MTDIKALIERLRELSDAVPGFVYADAMSNAANALEAMETDNERIKTQLEATENAYQSLQDELTLLRYEIGTKDRDETERELLKAKSELAEERRTREGLEQSLRIHKDEYAKRCDEIEQLEAKFKAARGGWADHISDGIDDDAVLKCVDGWIEERIAMEKTK